MSETAEMAGVEKFLERIDAEQALLATCSSLWKTLAARLAAVDESLRLKSETLAAEYDSVDFNSETSLASLRARECALPDRESSASARAAALLDAALLDLRSADPDNPVAGAIGAELVRMHCRRMDARSLWRLVAARRGEEAVEAEVTAAVEAEVTAAVAEEAVDPARLVLDAVEDFVGAGSGAADRQRWAVGVLLRAAFFPAKDEAEPGWSVAERAAAVAEKWREKLGPWDGLLFLQFVCGYGLRRRYDEQFVKDLLLKFAAEKDAGKVALALFKDKLPDVIREMIANKEGDAFFLVCGSGLKGEFPLEPTLRTSLKILKIKSQSISKKGGFTKTASDESRNFELKFVKSAIKCIEENNLEGELDLYILRQRRMHLGNPKTERKKDDLRSRSSKKRNRGSSRNGKPYPSSKGKKLPRRSLNSSASHRVPYVHPDQGAYGPPSGSRDSYEGGLGQNQAAFCGMSASYNAASTYGGTDYGAPQATPNYELSHHL